jgi:hypothetical protein
MPADSKAQREIDRTSDQPLQLYDLQRIRQLDFAGQVVIETPG